jgi:hypothetical protein
MKSAVLWFVYLSVLNRLLLPLRIPDRHIIRQTSHQTDTLSEQTRRLAAHFIYNNRHGQARIEDDAISFWRGRISGLLPWLMINQALAEPRLVCRASDRSSIGRCPTLNQASSTPITNLLIAQIEAVPALYLRCGKNQRYIRVAYFHSWDLFSI